MYIKLSQLLFQEIRASITSNWSTENVQLSPSPSNKMLLLIIMFEAKITSLDFAIFQGSNLKLDTCQFTIVYIVKH